MKSNIIELELHKCFENYLGKINIPEQKTKKSESSSNTSSDNVPTFVIILDISSSMGDQVPRMVNTVIPEILNNINGTSSLYTMTLITFCSQNEVDVYTGDASYISKLNIYAKGCTYMSYAIDKLNELITNNNITNKIIRLLSISDV